MEAIVLVLGIFFLVASTLTYVYLIETKRLKPHIPPRYKHEQAQRGNFWDSETQQFYKWEKLMELYETRKQNDTVS